MDEGGFTLVELLIVIGLLGAIAIIVISAINPIEQSNRARDTKYRADATQLISAIERYYTQKSEFVWQTQTPATYTSSDTAFPFITATDPNVGICTTSACVADGLLLTNDELKSEFRGRDFVKGNPTGVKQILVGKATGGSSSVYACFTPLSKSVRDKACADGKVFTLSGSTRTQIAAGSASCAAGSATWTSAPQYICLPE